MSLLNLNQIPVSELPKTSVVASLSAVGAIVLGIAVLFLYIGGWLTPKSLTPAAIIDTFEKVNGAHPGFRRNHAKGVCVSGYFESNGRGIALSKAVIFRPGRVPVIGRFALPGGQPSDTHAPREVRTMAILFPLPDAQRWRTGMS